MKIYWFIGVFLLTVGQSRAQTYSLQALKDMLLQNNGQLIAQKYQIAASDALVVQEKLWSNPTLSISEVNLWKNGTSETLPYLFGKYGQQQQVAVELEQLIETAGKRKKRISLKSLERKDALLDYEELLRELQFELDEAYWSYMAVSRKESLVDSIVNLYQNLENQYKRQSDLNNIPKSDYLRIQAALINFEKDRVELYADKNNWLTKIKVLTQNETIENLQIEQSEVPLNLSQKIPLDIEHQLLDQNIGYQKQINERDKAKQQLLIEKAERTPNLTFQLSYDRGGNIMRDFVGAGVSMDLPIWNRNKGNIKATESMAKHAESQQNVLLSQLKGQLKDLQYQVALYEVTLLKSKNIASEERKAMIANYQKHLQKKQITLLEFIDFIEAYQETETGIVDMTLAYQMAHAQLQYLTGQKF
ncbi:TolC family protein [Sphingobacterium sp. MYb388]|uniref:TolC family protein n=1 Tax=Sphingobacterium sp. MYb388 TaxID=2745437 RepID=UPI0030A9BBAE